MLPIEELLQTVDLAKLEKDLSSVQLELQQPEITSNISKYTELNIRYNELARLLEIVKSAQKALAQKQEAEALLSDESMAELAQIELADIDSKLIKFTKDLEELTLPKFPDDEKGAILEFRAGTGGTEASLFTEELYRAYLRYANAKGWSIEELDISYQAEGGFKEATFAIRTNGAFGKVRFEAGVHRVQRVPKTEAAGRIHTSAASIAILPIIEAKEIKINPSDIRIDVFRSSGPGGQSVNTTDSAVRITHLPTGIVVTCQDGKSQHKNKDKALEVLAAKLYQLEKDSSDSLSKDLRMAAIKDGDRSAKIRTFNFPQGRITDHRIKKSWFNISEVMSGDLEEIIVSVNQALRKNPSLEIDESE